MLFRSYRFAHKWYEMQQNDSLGSNGVDRVRSSRNTPTRLRRTNFYNNSERFATKGNQTVPNTPKWYETHQNISLGSNGVDRVCLLQKIPMQLRGTKFCTSSACFPPSFVRQPNSPEWAQMVRNAQKCHFRVQLGGIGCVRCEKI